MEYTTTLDTLESFLNALSRCSKHWVRASAILYQMVKVRMSWEFLIVVKKAPSSV